ncbi:MAG: DUF4199 domain-containing protein [Saprospiraceae bacterium]|nr:DUF4199 domain-containing protein [Saprospiraceae bacterium]NNK89849.1 DUF4199 domain-containing protein [Saprospiraceae bacterium]
MEENTRLGNAIKFGGMMGIILVVATLILYLIGMIDVESGKAGFLGSLLSYVISIGALILGISAYKKGNDNFLTVGDGVKQGMLIGIVGGLIVAIYNLVFFQFIEPDMLENIKETAIAQAEERGQINEDSEDMMDSMMNFFISPTFFFFTTVIMKFFLGLFVGLIAGAIMKNERPYEADSEV